MFFPPPSPSFEQHLGQKLGDLDTGFFPIASTELRAKVGCLSMTTRTPTHDLLSDSVSSDIHPLCGLLNTSPIVR